jgi:nitroreductase
MSIVATIKNRRSCRTYNERPLENASRAELEAFLRANTAVPFGSRVRFRLLDLQNLAAGELNALGTYGVIRGARMFIIGAVENRPLAMEDYGYAMERNILKAQSLGLGTCWLGGTFRRSAFSRQIDLAESELLPAITPVGYPGEKRSLTDRFFRFSAGSNERKPWASLFFDGTAETPLSEAAAEKYGIPLECVRLGPSASNKQPWRVVRDGDAFHFYLSRTPGYDKLIKGIRLQDIDMGIALCHFEMASQGLGLMGGWKVQLPGTALGDWEYIASWIARD